MTDFHHINSSLLRRVLKREPAHLQRSEIQRATRLTIQALGHNVIDDRIPEPVLHYRAEMAKEAREAVRRGQLVKAHSALRQFWRS